MVKILRKISFFVALTPLIFNLTGCDSNSKSSTKDTQHFNNHSDIIEGIEFQIPQEGDDNLEFKNLIPEGTYELTKLQMFIYNWSNKDSVRLVHEIKKPASLNSGDRVVGEMLQHDRTRRQVAPLKAQALIPLSFQVANRTFGVTTSGAYSARVDTTNSPEWSLQSGDTLKSFSIEETLQHFSGAKGIYSHIPSDDTKNTVFVVRNEDGQSVTLYFRSQRPKQTSYFRLEYTLKLD